MAQLLKLEVPPEFADGGLYLASRVTLHDEFGDLLCSVPVENVAAVSLVDSVISGTAVDAPQGAAPIQIPDNPDAGAGGGTLAPVEDTAPAPSGG
jgi:hypothetical protein